MRPTALLLLCLFAAPASAQPADGLAERLVQLSVERAGGDEPEPWEYFPLEVGNAWEYEEVSGGTSSLRMDIPKDTLIEGRQYFILLRRFITPSGEIFGRNRLPVRFDTLQSHVVVWSNFWEDDVVTTLIPCPFIGDLGEEVDCLNGGWGYVTMVTDEGVLDFEPDTTVAGVHAREYELVGGLFRYAAGFGEVYADPENDYPYRITYCRVGGEEFGTEQYPVASEAGAPEAESFTLSAYPNPFRERLTVAFEVARAGPVVVEVVDVLGRVVRRRDLGVVPPGRREVALGGEGLPAGVYAVRLAAGETQAVRRIVRVR